MVKQGGGAIVNIASGAARNTAAGESVYAAAKAGLVAFTHGAFAELRERGIKLVGDRSRTGRHGAHPAQQAARTSTDAHAGGRCRRGAASRQFSGPRMPGRTRAGAASESPSAPASARDVHSHDSSAIGSAFAYAGDASVVAAAIVSPLRGGGARRDWAAFPVSADLRSHRDGGGGNRRILTQARPLRVDTAAAQRLCASRLGNLPRRDAGVSGRDGRGRRAGPHRRCDGRASERGRRRYLAVDTEILRFRGRHRDYRGGVFSRLPARAGWRATSAAAPRWWRARRSIRSRTWCGRRQNSYVTGIHPLAGFESLGLSLAHAAHPVAMLPMFVGLFLLGLVLARGVSRDRDGLLFDGAARRLRRWGVKLWPRMTSAGAAVPGWLGG